jgi:DNA-binding NtrC family response regulator
MSANHTILIVDDEDAIRKAIKKVLRFEPYSLLDTGDPVEALDLALANPVHLIISDYIMPKMLGIDLLRKIRLTKPDTIRIILTGNANLEMAMQAINDGAIYRFITKPWDNNELLLAIRLGLKQYDTDANNRRLLGLLKKHADILEQLESRQPGITGLRKTNAGRIVVGDFDLDEAMKEFGYTEPPVPPNE